MSQVASVHDINVENKFDVSAVICFLVMLISIISIQTHNTHRPIAKNVIFGFRGPQNV